MSWVTLVDGITADADELMDNFYHVAQGDLLPRASDSFNATSGAYDLGSSAYRWNRLYINEIASSVTFSSDAVFNGTASFSGAVALSALPSGSRNLLIAVNQQANGTGGGPCGDSYSYTTTALSTLTSNYITGATLSSNVLTLPSGSYVCSFSFYTLAARCILYNNTTSLPVVLGDARQLSSRALFQDFTLNTSSSLVLKAAVVGTAGNTATAMGFPTSFGEPEMYGFLVVYKL